MNTVKIGGRSFLIDIEKTREYYRGHSLCNCADCRNYYAQIKAQMPELDAFLESFGVDIERPDECISIETDSAINYINVDYTVCGRTDGFDEAEIKIPSKPLPAIVASNGFCSPNEQTGTYFTLSIMDISLPWVLDEPFDGQTPPEKKTSFFNSYKAKRRKI